MNLWPRFLSPLASSLHPLQNYKCMQHFVLTVPLVWFLRLAVVKKLIENRYLVPFLNTAFPPYFKLIGRDSVMFLISSS